MIGKRPFLAPGLLRVARDLAIVQRGLARGYARHRRENPEEYGIDPFIVPPGRRAEEYGGTDHGALDEFLSTSGEWKAWKRLQGLGFSLAYSD